MITQGPILPVQNFTSRFNVAGQEGTLWWHARVSFPTDFRARRLDHLAETRGQLVPITKALQGCFLTNLVLP
jgi:hypothetical protein